MKKHKRILIDAAFTALMLVLMYALNQLLNRVYTDATRTLTPMLFVLGVFLISLRTKGFVWGISASVISVFLVNYAFTYPYYGIDLVSPECIVAAIVMLIVAIMTGMLTTRIKQTEKIKAEIEKESMRANLLRAVSHDLRTPLTTVYGSCSAIMENYDSLTKQQKLRLLGEIQEDSAWLIRMVENLLTVTKIGSDNVQVKKVSTVLEELIDAVLVKFHKRCPNQHVIVDIPDDFISIPMDALLIEQVLINMLENAVHHAKGMTELILRVSVNEQSALFEVIDDGCGIEEERMDNIFKGNLSSRTSAVDGARGNMGIGLAVCSSIVKAHDGDLSAANREEHGAVFAFALPLEGEENE